MASRGSEFAEEAVKRYVDCNLAMFHRVQVSQMIHLRCLTETDRQKILASCTMEGNNASTFEFLQRLCRREGWVPLFVEALREQNMGDLADKLEAVYNANLLPSQRTPPAASAPPSGFIPHARPIFPSQLAASPANPPPQHAGDYRVPIQENSYPAEKSKLAVHPESTDKGELGFSSSSDDSHLASNIGAAIERDRATESLNPYIRKEARPIPRLVEERPRLPPTTPTSAAGGPVENWDGRQHHPVTVKNGRFGNVPHPDDSGRSSPLPASAPGNQPEEDYYSSDSVLFPLPVQREDSGAERKVHALRGDGKQEKPPVVDSRLDKREKNLPGVKNPQNRRSHRPGGLQTRPFCDSWTSTPRIPQPASPSSAEEQTRLFVDPSSRSSPLNGTQPFFTETGAKPRRPVPSPVSGSPICLPPSDLTTSSSVERKPAKPGVELSAGGERDDIKRPVEEKGSWAETTVTRAVAGRPEAGMESRPSAIRDRQRDSHIFHSNWTEDDMPSKPGVLSSEHILESGKLRLDNTGEPSKLYSGSSERLRMSNSDSILGSASDSDPILVSNTSSAGNSTTSTIGGRSQVSGPLDASLPAEVDPGEEDTSLRSHHVRVEENRSEDLMGVPLDVASSWPSPRASPDSVSSGQPKNKAKGQAGPCFPDEKAEVEFEPASDKFRLLFAGFVLAAVAAAVFALYKKK